jgi:hypothetical protein
MDRDFIGILVVFFILFSSIRWWFAAKGTPYRNSILFMSVCWLITFIAYVLAMSFRIEAFFPVVFAAFFAAWFFLIRALFISRKFKK